MIKLELLEEWSGLLPGSTLLMTNDDRARKFVEVRRAIEVKGDGKTDVEKAKNIKGLQDEVLNRKKDHALLSAKLRQTEQILLVSQSSTKHIQDRYIKFKGLAANQDLAKLDKENLALGESFNALTECHNALGREKEALEKELDDLKKSLVAPEETEPKTEPKTEAPKTPEVKPEEKKVTQKAGATKAQKKSTGK